MVPKPLLGPRAITLSHGLTVPSSGNCCVTVILYLPAGTRFGAKNARTGLKMTKIYLVPKLFVLVPKPYVVGISFGTKCILVIFRQVLAFLAPKPVPVGK